MFTYIIIALIVIAIIGAFKAMTQEERSVTIKGATNVMTMTAVYSAKAAKGTIKAAYTAGTLAGSTVSLEGQETIAAVHTFNEDIKEEGGATKVAIKKANQHAEDLGLADFMKDMNTIKADLQTKLDKAREARA